MSIKSGRTETRLQQLGKVSTARGRVNQAVLLGHIAGVAFLLNYTEENIFD